MKTSVKIGQLNRAVILKKITTVTSTTGSEKETEVDFINPLWAALDDVSGNESEDGKVMYLNVRKYIIRYNEEVLTEGEKMLITDIDGTYNINSIGQIGFKSYLTLKCSKRE